MLALTVTPQVPSLKRFFRDANLNMKETLSAYLRSIKKNPDTLWEKIEQAIANVYVSKQAHISKLTSIVGDQRSVTWSRDFEGDT